MSAGLPLLGPAGARPRVVFRGRAKASVHDCTGALFLSRPYWLKPTPMLARGWPISVLATG